VLLTAVSQAEALSVHFSYREKVKLTRERDTERGAEGIDQYLTKER